MRQTTINVSGLHQSCTKVGQGSMGLGASSDLGDPKQAGDLGVRQALVESQDDGRALSRRKGGAQPPHPFNIMVGATRIGPAQPVV